MDPIDARHTRRDTLAVVLTVLGGAAWLSAPVALLLRDLRLILPVCTIAGCAIGAACVASLVPRLSRTTAAVAGAITHLLARGILILWALVPGGALRPEDLLIALAAAGAAAAGASVGGRAPRGLTLLLVAGMVSLAVATLGAVLLGVLHLLGGEAPLLGTFGFLLAPVAGGVVAAALFPEISAGKVAGGWLVLGLGTAAVVAVIAQSGFFFVSGLLAGIVLGVMPAGLGAIGAGVYRTLRPRPPVDVTPLPSARVLR